MNEKLKLTLSLQKGMKAEINADGQIIITIDVSETKRDLWDSQIEMWLSKTDYRQISSGYLRTIKNKLSFSLSRRK